MLNIIKPVWQWKWKLTPLNKKAITGIALHHMGSNTASVYDVNKMHNNKGWNGIAYNWWIGFDGKVYECRGWNIGGGVKGLLLNRKTISIGFQGNYHPTQGISTMKSMPTAQFNSVIELLQWLIPQLPNLQRIDGHKYFNKTACPGDYFPVQKIQNKLEKG